MTRKRGWWIAGYGSLQNRAGSTTGLDGRRSSAEHADGYGCKTGGAWWGRGKNKAARVGPGGWREKRDGAGCSGWRGWGRRVVIAGRRGEVGSMNTAAPMRWGVGRSGSGGNRRGERGGLER